MMIPDPLLYQLLLVALVWLCVMLHVVWPSKRAVTRPTPTEPVTPPRKRSKEPKPFTGLTHTPGCVACEQAAQEPAAPPPPPAPPPPIFPTCGRPRQGDTSQHCCPHPDWAYQGRVGFGNLSANGNPSGGPWRQLPCVECGVYFLETPGTILHGKRVSVDLIVRVSACLAEGLGIRGTARVLKVDPNTVRQWLVAAADQLRACSHDFLHDLHLTQIQLDELYAVLRALKEGTLSEDEALARLSRSPHWVWGAIDPVTKLWLAINVGARPLAMAQCVVHQVVQGLAPDCVPLFLTDG